MPHQAVTTTRLPFQELLERNDLGIIENPLRRVDEEELARYIRDFHKRSRLESVVDVNTLLLGGRLARDEEGFLAEENLDDFDTAALTRERTTSVWTESRELKLILLTCCIGSVVQGWVQGAIVGANQAWPRDKDFDLNLGFNKTELGGNINDIWIFSATNAITYFAASSVGALLCDPLTEIFVGRRGALLASAVLTLTASIGEAFTHSWQALFACRFILGIGMGAKSSVVPVYESEVSPARLRGQILTSWQTGTALGIAISGAVPLIVPDSWRFQISSSFIPALVLLLLVYVGSESPRWLIKKERYVKAYSVLLRLRENKLLAARDLVFIWAQLNVETLLFMRTDQEVVGLENQFPHLEQQAYRRQIGLLGYGRRIKQLFTIPRVRRSTLASFIVMCAQQMTGVNIFAFLASTLFDSAGIARKGSLWLFFGFGIANFLSSAVAYFYIDKMGRRWLLMMSLALMFPLLLASAFSFKAESTVESGLVATFLVLYTFAYSPGAGVVPFLYSSEIFPQVLREVGMAWASAVCWMGAGVLALTVPLLIHALGQTTVLGLFAGLDALALLLVWILVPGTERQIATMEEMNYVFGVTTRRHIAYQVNEVLPWCYDHYIRRRTVDVAPLYRYARLREESNGA